MESQRPRPDVVQIAHAFSMRAKLENVSYEAHIDGWLQEYSARATHTKKLSDLEMKVIKILPLQTLALQQMIAYHWQACKLVLQEPSVEPLMLQLKYGPWRSSVVRAWRQHRSSVSCPVFTKRTLQERARSLHTVLVTAVREVAQTGVSRYWAA